MERAADRLVRLKSYIAGEKLAHARRVPAARFTLRMSGAGTVLFLLLHVTPRLFGAKGAFFMTFVPVASALLAGVGLLAVLALFAWMGYLRMRTFLVTRSLPVFCQVCGTRLLMVGERLAEFLEKCGLRGASPGSDAREGHKVKVFCSQNCKRQFAETGFYVHCWSCGLTSSHSTASGTCGICGRLYFRVMKGIGRSVDVRKGERRAGSQ